MALLSAGQKLKIKADLIAFTQAKVAQFLVAYSEKVFYAFSYDCNATYTEVNLCFNAEEDFEKTLKWYQSEYGGYTDKSEIESLKYNSGDWAYQCFETIYVLAETEVDALFERAADTDESWVEELMELFCEALVSFIQTSEYLLIPKTDDFVVLCTDHDEDFETSQERLRRFI